jgi:hypothetical protein
MAGVRISNIPLSASLALLFAGPVSAQKLEEGRFDCALSSQGVCAEAPDGLCLGARIQRGPPSVFLKLDLGRGEASLNGIRGSVHRHGAGSMLIAWNDLVVLGSPTLSVKREGQHTWANLTFQGRTATFGCRTSNEVRRSQQR